MSEIAGLPRWLKLANPVIVALQRRGVVIGTMRLLAVPGRKSGQLRTNPVSPLTVEGERYIIAGLEEADWVKNARVAGWGRLGRDLNKVDPRRGAATPHAGGRNPRVVRTAQGETHYTRRAFSRITGRSAPRNAARDLRPDPY